MGFLIDTCVWIDVERGRLTPADVAAVTGDEPVFLSPVTVAELRFGVDAASDPGVRQRRSAALRRLQRRPCLTIDEVTGEVFGSLAAQLRAAGAGHRRRTQDVWLAAQAVQHGHRLLTRNPKDFQDIPGLDLVSI
jgi:predicted nucleic acid-binding protein